MSIIRTRLSGDGYTIAPNHWLRDQSISWKAKGLLIYIASHTVGYDLRTEQIIRESTDGRDSVLAGLRELENRGYLVRHYPRNELGHIKETIFELVECPDPPEAGKADRDEPPPPPPKPDEPETGKAVEGKAGQLRTPREENTKKTSSSTRGTRLAEDYMPTDEMKAWARDNCPGIGWDEHEKFRDHFLSVPGQRGVKTSWERAWKNWMREARDRKARWTPRSSEPSPTPYRPAVQLGVCPRHDQNRDTCTACAAELGSDTRTRETLPQ